MIEIKEADALVSVKELLSGGWSTANTSGFRPRFYRNIEQPVGRLDYTYTSPIQIIIYSAGHTNTPNGLGENYRDATVDRVSIDIRVKSNAGPTETWDLGRLAYNEVRSIISGGIVNNPDGSFQQILRDADTVQDFSTAGFFRYVMDVRLRNWLVER